MKFHRGAWKRFSLTLFLVTGACASLDSPIRLDLRIEEGRRAFLEGRPLESLETFKSLLRLAPNRLEVLHGYARASARLHLYDQAITSYQKAIEVSVRSGRIWQEYVAALASAATIRRDPRQLDTALKEGAAAIYLFPDRIGLYSSLERASAELKNRAGYLKLLTDLHEKLPEAPVLAAQLTKLRFDIARDHAMPETVNQLSERVKEGLEALDNEAAPDLSSMPADQLFHIYSDYMSLGDEGKAEGLIALLDRTPEGFQLTREHRRRRVEKAVKDAADSGEKLRIVNQALDLFKPTWEESDDDYWRLQALRFDILEERARARLESNLEPSDGEIADLVATGGTLGTADTYGGAEWYVRTSRVLVDLGQRLPEAIRLTETAIRRLQDKEPGLIYPARGEVDTSTVRISLISDLELIQAEAHLKNGQWVAAETLLRSVVENRPSGMAHALLARSLKAQGKLEEAYPEFVAALAEGFAPPQAGEQDSTLALAKETAAGIGKADRLEPDIGRQKRRLSQNEEIRIVSERLDLPAPDFELTDSDGKVWNSKSLRGSVVILNYWATWCGPCLKEFPFYSALVQEYATQPGVVFLAVSIDESTSDIKPWLEERGYRFTAVYDNGAASDFGIEEIPATILIDKAGRIQYRTVGFPGQERYLREMRLRINALTGD